MKPDTALTTSEIPNADPEQIREESTSPLIGLWAGLIAIFFWRSVFTEYVNLIPDECSYWVWSRRLDWSYFDNSGMVAYLIRLSTTVFGESTPFTVRFPFLILSGVTTFLVYRIGVILYQARGWALLAAVTFNATPLALLGGAAAVHDNALICFWTLTLWAAARFQGSGDGRWFYVMGLAAGLAMLSKYTGVLVVVSLVLFLLWSPEHRRRLLTREPWIGLLIAFCCTLPIIWWNARHEWASLHHILFIGSGSPSWGRRITDGLGYHLSQMLVVSPVFYAVLIGAAGSAFMSSLRKPRAADVLLLAFGIPVVLFGAFAFKGHVEANWAFMGYVSVGILAVEGVRRRCSGGGGGPLGINRIWFVRGLLLAVVPVAVTVLHAWVGLIPAALERSFGKADRIIWETRGWGGLGRHVAGLKDEGDVIAADTYQLCALLEFNAPGQPFVRYLAPWNRPTQFDVWEPSFDNLAGKTILFVSSRPLEPSSAVRTTLYEHFQRVERLPSYHVQYHGESIREVLVCRGYGFDPNSPRRLGPRSLFYRAE